MGGSDKVDDDSSIGMYNSGLKFSMALAIRNNIDLCIKVIDNVYIDSFDRDRETLYSIQSYDEVCEQTGKEKQLIEINKDVHLESFFSAHCEDLGGGDLETEVIKTGYSTKLGVDWSLWMLLRELYSNMVDENGFYSEDGGKPSSFKSGTIVSLRFEDDNKFAEIWNNRHLYINEKTPLFKLSHSVDVLHNEERYIRIYKQNILVFEDKDTPSLYAYNIKFGNIDERRILSDVSSVKTSIANYIKDTDNEDFLRTIITKDFNTLDKDFLDSNVYIYGQSGDVVNKIATEVYEEFGEVSTYGWLLSSVKERGDCKIAGKIIKSVSDSIWSYSKNVTVESIPESYSEPNIIVEEVEYISSFSAEIKKHYNFELDVEVKIAKLRGKRVICDKFEKCLIIDEQFKVENDFSDFIVEYLDLTQKGNVVDNLAKYICKVLKK
jgi:hypothetical protein